MKIAMIGWEFPPFMSGGLGIHCLELTTQLARMGTDIDFYMPHMEMEGDLRVANHHKHLKIHEIEADPTLSPYGGTKSRSYDDAFNDAVWQYKMRVVDSFPCHDPDVTHAHD